MFRASTAHHQEIRCNYVANGTSWKTVSGPGWSGAELRPADSHLTTFIYTLPPDDGPLMLETCISILIRSTKDKQCIELVIIHIIHDAGQPNIKMTVVA
jgi:hypothetical protein